MRLYNTLTRREEDFAPSRDNQVRMYSCGLTVYARGHIGNFRTFVAVDVLRRALKYQEGFDMLHVMNFTDVDDRTILESNKAGVPLREYTDRFIAAYREDSAALGLETPEHQPRATDDENIAAMTETIGALEQRGHTYQSDGSVYFKISTFPEYGGWPGSITRDQERRAGRQRQVRRKTTPGTSCCGRRASRVSRRGRRPSAPVAPAGTSSARRWRCGCSGSPIDLHAGGVDLIFPHHENEIAQSEGATGQQFSRFWMHVEHLMIEEETGRTDKMSKSLGNVFNLADIVEHGYRPSALRYLYLGVHYRKQLKFSWTAMSQAEESLKRLTDFLARLGHGARRCGARGRRGPARRGAEQFRAHIAADLNTAAGIGVIFDLVRALNSSIDSGEVSDADAAGDPRRSRSSTRSSVCCRCGAQEDERPPVPVDEIEQLIEARRAARLARNFAEADRIRTDLDARGITLEDTGAVTRWKRK